MPAGISQKADIGALQAEVDEQRRTIAALRAEIAASQERQARQALSVPRRTSPPGTAWPSEGKSSEAESAPKKSSAETGPPHRVSFRPAVNEPAGTGEASETPREGRQASYLRALTRDNDENETPAPEASRPPPLPASEPRGNAERSKAAPPPPAARAHQWNREKLDRASG